MTVKRKEKKEVEKKERKKEKERGKKLKRGGKTERSGETVEGRKRERKKETEEAPLLGTALPMDLSGFRKGGAAGEMPETKRRLLEAGKREFLEKGYEKASLRAICSACHVTTGAFYFFFKSKEELFCEIVDPAAVEGVRLGAYLTELEKRDLETGRENDRKIMEFLYRHKEEMLILMEGAKGSVRENFSAMVRTALEGYYTEFFGLYLEQPPRPELVRMLVNIRLESTFEILRGNYSMEETLALAEAFACYADGGFRELVKAMGGGTGENREGQRETERKSK